MTDFFGYIDPGTGSVFIQAVIGTVLAGTFILRNFIRQLFYRIKSFITRSKKSEAPAQAETTKTEDKNDGSK